MSTVYDGGNDIYNGGAGGGTPSSNEWVDILSYSSFNTSNFYFNEKKLLYNDFLKMGYVYIVALFNSNISAGGHKFQNVFSINDTDFKCNDVITFNSITYSPSSPHYSDANVSASFVNYDSSGTPEPTSGCQYNYSFSPGNNFGVTVHANSVSSGTYGIRAGFYFRLEKL